MSIPEDSFFVTGGTLRHDAPSYVERKADQDLFQFLVQGEFCYVLTSRQMGKSSIMVRAASRLRQQKINVVALDLTAVGQNLSPEQWYDGLVALIGRQLRLEDELDDYFLNLQRLSPVQRFFSAIRNVVLAQRSGPVVVFVDEIDTVRSLPFSTDEFFAAIRQCYNKRSEDREYNRLTFCLLGVATPSELIRDPRTTPFNIGHRIELTDFTEAEAAPLVQRLSKDASTGGNILERIFYWTHGHPYLTQRLCRAVVEEEQFRGSSSPAMDAQNIDALCEKLFLSPRARDRDDNLLFVRERILRSEADLAKLLVLYDQVHKGDNVSDDETDDRINQLRMAGIVDVSTGRLRVRNRIYQTVFDQAWIRSQMPDAEIEKPDGQRIRIQGTCNIGRASSNDLVLPHERVSRRHALIQLQKQQQFWLLDLGSSNGTFVNGKRVSQPVPLRNNDLIEIGPFRLIFHQSTAPESNNDERSNSDQTVFSQRTFIPGAPDNS